MKTTVFKNGKIYTNVEKQPWAQAVVVQGERIVYVGEAEGAEEWLEEGTEIIDLQGAMLLPGFIDAHAHPFTSAFQLSQIVLDMDMSVEEVLATTAQYIANHPENDAYFGIGYAEMMFGKQGPKKEELDQICQEKPVILLGCGGHEAWVNSKALQVAGVDQDFPDPVPGFQIFKRDAEGNPTGHLLESGPINMVIQAIKPFRKEDVKKTLATIFDDYAKMGVTAIIDCGIFDYMEEISFAMLDELVATHELKQRVFGSNFILERAHLQGWQEKLKALSQKYDSDLVRYHTFKLINDGSIESRSAALFEPYDEDDSMVEPLFCGQELQNLCLQAAQAGYDIHLHGIGDKTIWENLMAAKAVREAGFSNIRMTNAHTHCVREQDLPLFHQYDVIANTTGVWHYGEEDTEKIIGKQRADNLFPMRTILSYGAKMSLGSDFPGDEYGREPLNSMEVGMTRQMLGQPQSPILLPESERLSAEQVIAGYTSSAAYQVHMEEKLGTIAAGKYADLVVLKQNLLEVDPYKIHEIPVLMTWMNGKVTYQATK